VTLSILDAPKRKIGARVGEHAGPYDAFGIEDEALSLIYNPESHGHSDVTNKGPTLFNQVHPNCITFAEDGRLFVGDSEGVIHSWTIVMRGNSLCTHDHFKI
jgi:hypothetical protein